ncbi:MAG: acyl-CoA thioesterase [Neisseriaceae bacterium]|nr:acyl-CoA thioesterase [Neisseriaceae bacterium]
MPYIQHVHNYHLDGYGHVNNARYLEFLEAARWHFFAQKQLKDDLRAAQLVVAQLNIRYRRAASLDEELHIHTKIIAVQSRQIIVEQTIYYQNQLCVRAQVTLMPTDEHGRVFRLPENLYQTCLRQL